VTAMWQGFLQDPWAASQAIVNDQLSETSLQWRRLTVLLLRFVCPLAIAAVFVASLV